MSNSDTTTPRNEDGTFDAEHDVGPRDVFAAMEPSEPYTTGELAEAVGIPRRTAYNYLADLAAAGDVRKKKVDPRRIIWIREGTWC